MSDFADLLSEGFDAILDQCGFAISFNGKSVQCVPASQPRVHALRDSGLWEQGMVIVELTLAAFAILGIPAEKRAGDRSVVDYDGRKFKVFTIDQDPADPCVRLTLKPDH